MAGRKRTPTELKLVTGNPGKRPLNENEPRLTPGIPSCPKHLTDRAKRTFRQLGKQLLAMSVITKADGLALEMLVNAYEEYRDAADLLYDAAAEKVFEGQQVVEMKDGLIYKSFTQNGVILRAHPANALRANAWRRVMSALSEFGLTPSARSKVGVVGSGPAADPFEQFLRASSEQG